MIRRLLIVASSIALSAVAANPERAPVLVELFTSEGCSSCPPADRLLERLDPQVVVLGEHVDYWDRLGWKDRFSSHAYTERQQWYARAFGLDSPYTPQMIVDGVAQFTGGDARRAADEIAKAASRPKAEIHLTRSGPALHVEIAASPENADVMLALADNDDSSQVSAGENKGHNLHHVGVARSLRKIGSIKRGARFSTEIALPPETAAQRVVVFVQQGGPGRVLGVALK